MSDMPTAETSVEYRVVWGDGTTSAPLSRDELDVMAALPHESVEIRLVTRQPWKPCVSGISGAAAALGVADA